MKEGKSFKALLADKRRKLGLCPTCGREVCNTAELMRKLNGDR